MRYQKCRWITPENVFSFTTLPCPHCKKVSEVHVRDEDLLHYNQKGVWPPGFSRFTAEQLISGTHEMCWEEIFCNPKTKPIVWQSWKCHSNWSPEIHRSFLINDADEPFEDEEVPSEKLISHWLREFQAIEKWLLDFQAIEKS